MNDLDTSAFVSLFKEAHLKCFGYPMREPLSETESKLFYNQVFEQTGLVIGWKSIKNYSFFVLDNASGKPENPSIATLDTLARYVSNAPYITETQRKDHEGHYPFWFGYKEQFHRSLKKTVPRKSPFARIAFFGVMALIILVLILFNLFKTRGLEQFTEDFHTLAEDSLAARGWLLKSKDSIYWNRRDEKQGYLSLFTLKGDNWPDVHNQPAIRNLLLRKVPCDCFVAETHFSDFIPRQKWQQAGIILLEDSNLTGKSIRLSVAYNDFFGGYAKPKEIIVQAITSLGKGYGEPEEIAHQPLLYLDSVTEKQALLQNLQHVSLKIEKRGRKFRFLYAGGSVDNPAFKEVTSHEFDMQPRYAGIFALKGFADTADNIPVHFRLFRLTCDPCDK